MTRRVANQHTAPQSPHFLGIDLGTSGVRAFVIDTHENVIEQARIQYPGPVSSTATISPDDWWQAVTEVLNTLFESSPRLASKVVSICVDGTSSSVLISDDLGHPLTEALMYFDQRATQQADRIREVAPNNHPAAAPTSGLAKWLWLEEHNQFTSSYYYLHQADWISGKLAGTFGFSDENNALKSGYDSHQKIWPDWVQLLVANESGLPQVKPASTAVCTISSDTARQFGFAPDTLILSGTTDSTAAVIATGASEVGDAITSLGSTLVIKVISDKPVSDASTGIYSQPFGRYWLVGGASNSGGAVLRQHFTDQQMRELEQRIDVNQATLLDYYPLPGAGERFPVNDPTRVSRTSPRPKDDIVFFQGLLEGIANIEYQSYSKLHACGVPWPKSIRTTGGGNVNNAWKIIRQNILKIPMVDAIHVEAAFGSAILARRGWENFGLAGEE